MRGVDNKVVPHPLMHPVRLIPGHSHHSIGTEGRACLGNLRIAPHAYPENVEALEGCREASL